MRDIGANLTGKQFFSDLGEVITRARQAGVDFIDVTGTDLASSEAALVLAKTDPNHLGATAGIHPHAAKTLDNSVMQRLQHFLAQPETLMCGEMGLDFARNFSTPDEQRRAFDAQLDLAEELEKPLFLHCREAFDEFLTILDRRPTLWKRSIVHCFTGDARQARAIIERGGYIGVTGWITDKRRNVNLLAAMSEIPTDRLLIETDAPYLMPLNAPQSQMRDRNEPANLGWVARSIAPLIGCSPEKVMAMTSLNAENLIGRAIAAPNSVPHP